MSIDNQIEPPQVFMAMYLTPGRDRLNAPQSVVLARYEHCEAMAMLLAEQAHNLAFQENLAEREVLKRCYQGLMAESSGFNEKEAAWVCYRLAELLGWPIPCFE